MQCKAFCPRQVMKTNLDAVYSFVNDFLFIEMLPWRMSSICRQGAGA